MKKEYNFKEIKDWKKSQEKGKCNVCGTPIEIICRCEVNKFKDSNNN